MFFASIYYPSDPSPFAFAPRRRQAYGGRWSSHQPSLDEGGEARQGRGGGSRFGEARQGRVEGVIK